MVIMAGYADKMAALMGADPGMPRRFVKTIDLPDYDPEELAEIAEGFATRKLKLRFAPGLQAQLAEHIRTVYAEEIADRNAGLAINITEAAFRKLARRAVTEDLQGEACTILVPADFGIAERPAGQLQGDAAPRTEEEQKQAHDLRCAQANTKSEAASTKAAPSVQELFTDMVQLVMPGIVQQQVQLPGARLAAV